MPKTTQLYPYHSKHAKMTEFAGYEMPLWYTTTKEEHVAVRNGSGMFDVSHMGRLEVSGERSTEVLEGLLPTQVSQQAVGKAFYTLLLNDGAGIVDDLIVMRTGESRYMVVVNAANAQTDIAHMAERMPSSGVEMNDITSSSVMIAVQGPGSANSLQPLVGIDLKGLKRFRCSEVDAIGNPALISRTGYTGEDGFEMVLFGPTNDDPTRGLEVWERLSETSRPCGLGARDSLRLEAGFPLHGSDIDPNTDPFQADLSWVIAPGKTGYVGSDRVAELKSLTPESVRKGLLVDKGIPRHGFEVKDDSGRAGVVTSGTYSPIVEKGIALCKIDVRDSNLGTEVMVDIRDEVQKARVVKTPFYDEKLYGWKRLSKGN